MLYSAVKYKKFGSQRRFGVELETGNTLTKPKVRAVLKTLSQRSSFVSKYQLSGDSTSWHVKDDATCGPMGRQGPKGVEIASFVGKGITDLQHIAEVADGLFRAGCRVNDNCGLHVHAEAKDLTPSQVGVLLAYWIKIEPVLEMSLPLTRWGNIYCRSVLDKHSINRASRWSAMDLWTILKPGDLSYYENEDRRVNLNVVNFARAELYGTNHRKTLELRWPEGTLDGRDVKCWVRLFLGFIDACKDLPMPEDLYAATLEETLTYLGLNHGDKTFIIFSEGLHDTKTWFLERILQHSSSKLAMALKGHPVLPMPSETIQSAKQTLDLMWSPVKKYA